MRFIRSRVHTIDPVEDDNLSITYTDESGEKKSEVFDLVVLSVGMEVSEAARTLAGTVGVELNRHDFVATDASGAGGHLPARCLRLRRHAGPQGHSRIGDAGLRGRGRR